MANQRGFYDCLQAVKSLKPGPDCRYQLYAKLESLLLFRYHPTASPPPEDIEDVLLTCIRLVPPSYVQLVSKMSQLIQRSLSRNTMVLSRSGFEEVIAFTMTAITTEWTAADGLKALASLLHRHSHLLSPKYIEALASCKAPTLGLLFKLLMDLENAEACSAAAQCLGLLAQKPAPHLKPALDEGVLSHILASVLDCLKQATASLPENVQAIGAEYKAAYTSFFGESRHIRARQNPVWELRTEPPANWLSKSEDFDDE